MKVGKEEIAGLLTALELYMEQDEDSELREWERRCRMIGDAVSDIEGVSAEYRRPATPGHPPGPVLHVDLSPDFPISSSVVDRKLQDGDPPIHVGVHPDYITVDPQTLQDGDAEIIASRLREVLRQS
jgi:L-seryl-tRNA(Ser) seleniumtransferase